MIPFLAQIYVKSLKAQENLAYVDVIVTDKVRGKKNSLPTRFLALPDPASIQREPTDLNPPLLRCYVRCQTGTLTENRLALARVLLPSSAISPHYLEGK